MRYRVANLLQVAPDDQFIIAFEFQNAYQQARRLRAAIRGLVYYLKSTKQTKLTIVTFKETYYGTNT